ncbi:hypothetical protein CAPTEDRAFT_201061 [Capitella teleta]|uniref:C-type lectin domain-containing protein n=1 Tax=Capitella teleta TaxID=283909 RepID=R7VEE0_CAPTE|nr:hypothetical protein CAPTEDRAFT_201061 [Capitella teleta]|eukprot:ELU17178.1 hypothetical protein CAPTEDRAFT_201061 [Capitella teleta]
MKILIALTLALSATVVLGDFEDPATCDVIWRSVEGVAKSCYKFHNEKKRWVEAYSACPPGMHLLALETEAELAFITRYIKQYVVHTYRQSWWTAGKGQVAIADSWFWKPGNTPIVFGWGPGEPNNNKNRYENCVSYFRYALNDDACYSRFPYICEHDF